ISQGETTLSLRLAGALWKFWFVRGHLSEGRSWLDQALGLSGDQQPDLRAEALYGAGCFAREQGDLDRAVACGKECLALAQATGSRLLSAMALSLRGSLSARIGALDIAQEQYEESLALFRQLRHDHGVAMMLARTADMARFRGDLDRA